jgi:hypothetical protein
MFRDFRLLDVAILIINLRHNISTTGALLAITKVLGDIGEPF